MILNLLSNAARYTEAGGITVCAAHENSWVTISVADTGPGIPAQDLSALFEPFYQGVIQARRAHMGSGLGLNPQQTTDVALAVRKLTNNRGADVALECSGSARALNEAIRTVGFQGRVVAVSFITGEARGLYLGEEFHHNRIRILGSQASGVNPEVAPRWNSDRKLQAALALLPELNLQGLITHCFPFEQAAQAYEEVDQRPERSLQVILTYP